MHKHRVTRFAAKNLYNSPHLITQDALSSICAYVEMRNSGVAWNDNVESLCLSDDKNFTPSKYTVENGIATIVIDGTLTAKPTMFSMLCGGTSYEELSRIADEIAEDISITHVVLMISSGGGEAYSCFSTAAYIKNTLKNSGKTLITYVDGLMASAAYAIGCISDEVVVNPDSQTGSIGVVVSLMDNSKELEMEGLKPVWVYAGDSKIPYAEDGSFKQEFLDDLQNSVNFTYNNFTRHVSEMRGISVEDIVKTQAKLFKSPDAISLGLADKQMTIFEFADYLASIVNTGEVELPESKPSHHEGGEDHDEDAGCGKKKKTSHQELTSESVSESLTNISGDQSLENLEELLAMKAEFEANKQQMAELSAQIEQLNALKAQAEEQAAKLAAEKLAHQKAEKMQSLEAYNFMDAAQKEALVDFAMANESMGSMLFSMFAKANEAIGLAAQEVVAVKEAFGSEKGVDTALDVVVEAEKSAQEVIQERINAIKAQSAK